MTALTPSFQLKFGHTILPGLVAVGKFDGSHASLACATTGGRVFIHNPQESGGASAVSTSAPGAAPGAVRFLNINRDVTALAAGPLAPGLGRDVLIIGTANSLQAYDVADNRDLFYKEVPDGVSAAVVGSWSGGLVGAAGSAGSTPVAFAGGNCSVSGFDAAGKDVYWTVTGDVVTALAMGDVDGDGAAELLAGSADFDIRIYRGDDIVGEVTETDRVIAVAVIGGGRYAYCLANGTVGVYGGGKNSRVWRVKTKAQATAIAVWDVDCDGELEVICTWANGRLEARRAATGELVYRDMLGTPAVGLAVADYRGDGRPLLLVISGDGELRAYAPSDVPTLAAMRLAAGSNIDAGVRTPPAMTAKAAAPGAPAPGSARGTPSGKVTGGNIHAEGGALATLFSLPEPATIKGNASAPTATASAPDDGSVSALLRERAKLELELRAAEAASIAAAAAASSSGAPTAAAKRPLGPGDLPAALELDLVPMLSPADKHLALVASVGPGDHLFLRALVVYALDAGGIFGPERESALIVPPPPAPNSPGDPGPVTSLRVPISITEHRPAELRVLAIVGARRSATFHAVLEKTITLPRFAMFAHVPHGAMGSAIAAAVSAAAPTKGSLSFVLTERASRVAQWIARGFSIKAEAVPVLAGTAAHTPALDVRFLHVPTGTLLRLTVAGEHGGDAVVYCDDIELAGDIVRDMAASIGVRDLETSADFPAAFAGFRATLSALDECNAIRLRLTGEMAQTASAVKGLVIQAEDTRLLGEMKAMRRCYGELRALNGELLGEYMKRAANHAALVKTLKDVNVMIQRGANLRVGEPKSRIIAACRAAVKENNTSALISIIAAGKPAKGGVTSR